MVDQSAQIQRLLKEAIGAAQAGDNKYARPLLRRVVSLDPQNEMAWLWLSQVEETAAGKIQALEQALQINPANDAARRGLERLREEAGRAATTQRSQTVAQAEESSPARSSTQAAGPKAQLSPMEDLRPMLEASRRRKSPFRLSELVILLIAIVAILLIGRIVLDLLFPDPDARPGETVQQAAPANQPAGQQASQEQPPLQPQAPAPTNTPSISQPVEGQPSAGGATGSLLPTQLNLHSPTYSLHINTVTLSESSVVLNVTLSNPGTAAVRFKGEDFRLLDAGGATLKLDPARSSLLPGNANVFVPIVARSQATGTLTFQIETIQVPLRLVWQPSDTTVSHTVELVQ